MSKIGCDFEVIKPGAPILVRFTARDGKQREMVVSLSVTTIEENTNESDEEKRFVPGIYWAAGKVRLAFVGCLALLMLGGVASADTKVISESSIAGTGGPAGEVAGAGQDVLVVPAMDGGQMILAGGDGGRGLSTSAARERYGANYNPRLTHAGRGGGVTIRSGRGELNGYIALESGTGLATLNGKQLVTVDMTSDGAERIAMHMLAGAFLATWLFFFLFRRRLRANGVSVAALFLLGGLSACGNIAAPADIAPTWDASVPQDLTPVIDKSVRLEAKCPPEAPVYDVEHDCCHSREGECPNVRAREIHEKGARVEACGMIYTVGDECDIIATKRAVAKSHPVRLHACGTTWIATDKNCTIKRTPKEP